MTGFTAIDLYGATLATLAFAVVLLPPGYLLGRASDLLGFRTRSAVEQLLISVALSVAVAPLLAVLVGRVSSMRVVLIVFVLLTLAAVGLSVDAIRRSRPLNLAPSRTTWIALAMLGAWFGFVVFSLVDLQLGGRLYFSFTAYDACVRQGLVQAAARTGVPPLNPFYGIVRPPVMRYFYYWYVLCAVPMRIAGVSSRAALDASVVWCGVALASLVPLYLKHFLKETANLRAKSLVGISLLLVTGLDIIPTVILSVANRVLVGDTEKWEPNQVTSWFGALLWTPHHVAGLIACLVGFLALAGLDDQSTVRRRAWAVAIAGIAFAGAAGLSIFVTMAFAVFAILWTALLLVGRHTRLFMAFAASGVLALLLSLPYLGDLRGPSITGEHVLQFAFRGFPNLIGWLQSLGLDNLLLLRLANVVALIPVYFLEFGFFAVVGFVRFRSELQSGSPLTTERRAAWVMMTTVLVVITFIGSSATDINDFGIRGAMVVQFILLLWAAPLVSDIFVTRGFAVGRPLRLLLGATLILGAVSTLDQCFMLRFYGPLSDRGAIPRTESWMGVAPDYGTRNTRFRTAFAELAKQIPESSVIQYNPTSRETRVLRLYSSHQMVAADVKCGAAFGGDEANCALAFPYLTTAFGMSEQARKWNIDTFCDTFGINVLVFTEVDPVWQDREGWVWMRPPIVSNEAFRAIPCGKNQPTAR